MTPRRSILSRLNEADIQLALSALDANQIWSTRRAAAIFNVPETTLRNRRASRPSRQDSQPNRKKLTLVEEEVIIQYILNLNQRGFPPTYALIGDIADSLLAARRSSQVGVY
jgi:hypothetical protein